MKYSTNTFINLSNNLSIWFVVINFILIIFILIFNPLIKFKKIKNKYLNNRNFIFFTTILGIIIGLIFLSFNNFDILNIKKINLSNWVWDAISFVYSFGLLAISLLLITVWFIVPFICFKTVTKFMMRNDYNIEHEVRKILLVVAFIIITIGISNIGWIFPLNDPNTPMSIFKINNGLFLHDKWFFINKWMFEHCYLTEWYSWAFLGYFLICLLISYIIIKIKNHNIWFLNKTEYYLEKFSYGFHIFDSFGGLCSYCFICAYMLLNWSSMFIHIAYILMILTMCYLLIVSLLIIIYAIKYKNEKEKWSTLTQLFKLGFINHFTVNKPKHKFNTINITDVSVVALVFIIYMGFTYNFNVNEFNQIVYSQKLSSFTFWFQVVIGALIFNIVSESRSYNSSWTKLIFAEATYSVAPGLQTGILTWINPLFKPVSNFVNNISALLI